MKIQLAFSATAYDLYYLQRLRLQNNSGKIAGAVTDLQHNPLPGATVTLDRPGDTTTRQIRLADKNGAFVFDHLAMGVYRLVVSHIGFNKIRR